MSFRKRGLRAALLGLMAAAGLALAPAAFAGGHFGVGINLPGVSVGYSGCGHCGHFGGFGHSRGFVDIGFGGFYAPYYGAAYYGGYYSAPYAYPYYPSVGVVYDRPVVVHRGYPGHYYHAGYYARDGYYRH